MTSGRRPICIVCKYLHNDQTYGFKCDAFPDGIPQVFIISYIDHRKPYPDDHGIQFESIGTKEAEYFLKLLEKRNR